MTDSSLTPSGGPMNPNPSKIEKQVAKAGVSAAFAGGGTLFSEPILVINQKAKWIDVVSEYSVMNQAGAQVGAARQEGGKKWVRFFVNKALLPANVAIVDASGTAQCRVDKKFSWFRPKVFLQDGSGQVIGQFVWAKMLGKQKINFTTPDGQVVGSLNALNLRAWNFSITDPGGTEVATISKTWSGLGKEMFTNADHYVLSMNRKPEGLLGLFTVAAALCVDTVLKQSNT